MEKEVLYTPVLMLAFNRPEQTQKVFDVIRSVKPQKLYVAVDAPREGRQDDVENCEKVKAIVQNVDWPCETHYLFQEKNLGCSLSGYTAWNWIFETEDRMIFVEDDGYSSKSAFFFVQDLLEKYKDEKRIAYVSPINYGPKFGEYSYFFSRYFGGTYFMGTWKRVHDLYDYNLESYNDARKETVYNRSFVNVYEKIYYRVRFTSYIKSIKENRRFNTYDLQMSFLAHRYDMISVCSNVSMVRNIGFSGGANTAVVDLNVVEDPYLKFPIEEIDSINYTPTVQYSKTQDLIYANTRMLYHKSWFKVTFKAVMLKHFGVFYNHFIKPFRNRRTA